MEDWDRDVHWDSGDGVGAGGGQGDGGLVDERVVSIFEPLDLIDRRKSV